MRPSREPPVALLSSMPWRSSSSRHVQVTHEKLGLVADGVLKRLSEVDVEVADRVALDLAARRGRRVAQRGLGGGPRAGVADPEQEPRGDPPGRNPAPGPPHPAR